MVIWGKPEEIDAMSEAPPLEELTWTPQMIARFWDYEKKSHEEFFTYQVGRVLVRHFEIDEKRGGRTVSRLFDEAHSPPAHLLHGVEIIDGDRGVGVDYQLVHFVCAGFGKD